MDNFQNGCSEFASLRERLKQIRNGRERARLLGEMIQAIREREAVVLSRQKKAGPFQSRGGSGQPKGLRTHCSEFLAVRAETD